MVEAKFKPGERVKVMKAYPLDFLASAITQSKERFASGARQRAVTR